MIQMTDRQFQALADIARREAGLDIPVAKKVFLAARLQKRLRAVQVRDIEAYLDLASRDDPQGSSERDNLIFALTTNVTSIWREVHHFKILAEELVQLTKTPGRTTIPIRIWSAGCSSGAELISIAATCRYALGENWSRKVAILGTDIDLDILADCRTTLETSVLSDLIKDSPFPIDPNWQWNSDLSRAITLQRHNLLTAPPDPRNFDIVFCRNVTIYFDRECQARAQETLLKGLKPNSVLFLGHSERLHDADQTATSIGRTAFRILPTSNTRILR